MYKENLPLNNKKKILLKCGQIIYRYFTKEHIQMANKYVKRCSTLLGKHKSKPQCYTTSYSLDKNLKKNKAENEYWQGYEYSHTLPVGICNGAATRENIMAAPQKVK